MPKKKYNLKCFSCGDPFPSKEFVIRIDGIPLCGQCVPDDIYWDYEEESDQDQIDRANIARYGEY